MHIRLRTQKLVHVRLDADRPFTRLRLGSTGILKHAGADPHHELLPVVLLDPGMGMERRRLDIHPLVGELQIHPALRLLLQLAVHHVHRRAANEPRHEQVRRVVEQLRRRSDLRQVVRTLRRHRLEHRNPMTQRHRLNLVMGHIHRCRAQPQMQPAQLGTHRHPQLRIQVRQRLIHQERLRLTHNRATHRDPLPLTTRQSLRLTLQEIGDLEHFSSVIHAALDLILGRLTQLQPERHIVIHRHMRIQRIILEHHRNIAVLRGDVIHQLVTDVHLPLRDLLQTRDHAQHRRLATPRRTHKNQELAVSDGQCDLTNRTSSIRVDLPNILKFDLCHS